MPIPNEKLGHVLGTTTRTIVDGVDGAYTSRTSATAKCQFCMRYWEQDASPGEDAAPFFKGLRAEACAARKPQGTD